MCNTRAVYERHEVMRVLKDIQSIYHTLKGHIEKFGSSPAHNVQFLLFYYTYPGSEALYFDWGKEGGVLGWKHKSVFGIIGEPLSDSSYAFPFLYEMLEFFRKEKNMAVKKILVEDCGVSLKKQIDQGLKRIGKVHRPDVFYWPVLDMRDFDEQLRGSKWKRLRYATNVFSRTKNVVVTDAAEVEKDALELLVHRWRKGRTIKERTYYHQYLYAVQNGFAGCDIKKAVFIQGNLAALIAGWNIPNTRGYYSFIDIHDYRYQHIGEFANALVLRELKKRGVDYVDFGGSDKRLLMYKMKFQPTRFYKTYNFYISAIQ